MKTVWIAVAMVLSLMGAAVAEAQQAPTQKKYLVLGADPQAQDRQPTEDEEVVIVDHDICDSGWGTGSGKKVAGCYPKHSAVLRNKTTGYVTAMFVCGNEPTGQLRVTGKVVAAKAITVVSKPTEPLQIIVSGIPEQINVNVVHSGTVNVVHSGEVKTTPITPAEPTATTSAPWQLGLAASGTPVFTSKPIMNGVDTWMGQESDLRGMSLEAGVTFGKPSYYLTLGVDWKKLNSESVTRYKECDSCGNGNVVHHLAENISMIGPRAEFTLLVGKGNWRVRPTVSAYAGTSYVSGTALRGECPDGHIPSTWVPTDGREFFGKSWVSYAGADIGASIKLTENTDMGVRFGVNSLGMYPLRIGVNYKF